MFCLFLSCISKFRHFDIPKINFVTPKGAFNYFISTFGEGGLSQNADAGKGGWGGWSVVCDNMLTLLTLGSGGVGKLGLRT